MAVEIGGDGLQLETVKSAQPFAYAIVLGLTEGTIEFGAIAGGENHRFVDARLLRQAAQRRDNDIRTKGDLLADTYRSGFVIQSKGEQRHQILFRKAKNFKF